VSTALPLHVVFRTEKTKVTGIQSTAVWQGRVIPVVTRRPLLRSMWTSLVYALHHPMFIVRSACRGSTEFGDGHSPRSASHVSCTATS
jgi:hypothetical protein